MPEPLTKSIQPARDKPLVSFWICWLPRVADPFRYVQNINKNPLRNSMLTKYSIVSKCLLLCVALSVIYTSGMSANAEESNDRLKTFVHQIIQLNDVRLQRKLESLLEAKIKDLEYDEIKYSVEYESPDLLSIIFTCIYTGGAHPDRYYVSFSAFLTPQSVSEVTLSNVFKPKSNYLKFLSDYCIADLKKQGAGLIVNNYIKDLTKGLNVFSFTAGGLKFYFAPYEVGSYAEGSYYVTVPYKELKNILAPDSPLLRLVLDLPINKKS